MDLKLTGCKLGALALVATILPGCALLGGAPAPETPLTQLNIKDPNFAQCIKDTQADNLGEVRKLLCANYRITEVDELHWLPNLEVLDLTNNRIEAIDTSHNPKLKRLTLTRNKLTELDVSNNLKIERLNLESNRLSRIKLGKAQALTALYAYKNPVAQLDIANKPELKDLGLSRHQLATLDLSQSPKLRSVNLSLGQLSSLNLSQNPELVDLRLGQNQLTALDLSNKPKLQYANIEQNKLAMLDVSASARLTELHAGQNQLVRFTLGQATGIEKLNLNHNQLFSLDLSDLSNPKAIALFQNPLKDLSLPKDLDRRLLAVQNTPWGEKHPYEIKEEPIVEVLAAGLISQENGRYQADGYRTVLADLKDYVGIQYSVQWPPALEANGKLRQQLPIKVRVTHPELTPPNGEPFTESVWADNMYLHDNNLAMWQFTEEWEMAEGRWQFEVIYQDKVVARDAILVQFPIDTKQVKNSIFNKLAESLFSSEYMLCNNVEYRECMSIPQDSCRATLENYKPACRAEIEPKLAQASLHDPESLTHLLFDYFICLSHAHGEATQMSKAELKLCLPPES